MLSMTNCVWIQKITKQCWLIFILHEKSGSQVNERNFHTHKNVLCGVCARHPPEQFTQNADHIHTVKILHNNGN